MNFFSSINFRMIVGFIAIVIVVNVVSSLFTILHIQKVFVTEVQTRVRLDLNSAHNEYNNQIAAIEQFLQASMLERESAPDLTPEGRDEFQHVLRNIRQKSGIDILLLLDAEGRAVNNANPEGAIELDLTQNPLVAAALQESKASGTCIMPFEQLQLIDAKLTDNLFYEMIETQDGSDDKQRAGKMIRMDGMVIGAVTPLFNGAGHPMGYLFGADLLNRRFSLVDSIKDEVFQGQLYQDREIGAVTIFQDDLRIATNVMDERQQRAIGTRMSREVYQQVFAQKDIWNARAFVVNDWYITAYEPIKDPTGKIIGALYVGLLEAPFIRPQSVIVWVYLAKVGVMALIFLGLLVLFTNRKLRPIHDVVRMAQQVVHGDLSARVTHQATGEMGELCEAVNQMADTLAQREAELKTNARRQLGQSEKLASIGRLAAGVAHEINNPLTGVQTFAHLLLQKESLDEETKSDLNVIVRETLRVRDIVRSLLDFARESPSTREQLNLNDVVERTMKLLRSQKAIKDIKLELHLSPNLPLIMGDKNQLQQVLLNLMLNACEAMPEGGTLTLATEVKDQTACIKVIDSGSGIKQEHIDKIFDPFFTTKPVGKGTGLGLSVSLGIVQKHGGNLSIESEEEKGSTFIVSIPVMQPDSSATDNDEQRAAE